MSTPARSPAAVRASLTDRLGARAKATGQSVNLVRRQFVMSRFLTRVFDADPDLWILKGGIGMMVRLPQSRYSKDIDLLIANDTADPIEELRRTVRDHHLDHFRFEVGPPRPLADQKGSKVTVIALLGGRTFDTFSIDIVDSRRELVGQVERHPIPRLVDTDDFTPETSVLLYPLADQIADKLCAMYEVHGAASTASGRYRDLVDLLLIAMFLPIDLATTAQAVERERTVRGIPALPTTLVSPGPSWTTHWSANAKKSPLTSEHHDLDTALAVAGNCYNHILAALPTAQRNAEWDHQRRTWMQDRPSADVRTADPAT
ncbi:nucleotidyl transferase AbiEii/AbiGii toxin family protein [Tomitella biformata]|uniref:nucleotidyl transferase AbiEii/AbiGii toxin family protein n=1 Tax=Tomitella biformata TaxID=630403 RepID=UPI000465C755|nr:nucleotidyl transferase AbiEii/AbiGii toxin family protein [Tomitella biformata]